MSCSHAIYTVKSVVSYYCNNNSTVNLCALDLSRAFDTVNYSMLFMKLMDRNLPRNIIVLLSRWYQCSTATVKWNRCESFSVPLSAGVRQGGILSPHLFAVFVDDLLIKLSTSSLGCRYRGLIYNALMYADDLLLLSISIHDLQKMVDICYNFFNSIGLTINIAKSACLRIGSLHNVPVADIVVNNTSLSWKCEIKYLGVTFVKSSTVKCNLQSARHKFFKAVNGIFGKIGTKANVNVLLSLMRAYCNPVLTYGLNVINLTKSMYNEIESAYSSAFSKIFQTFDKGTIAQCQYYCGALPASYLIDCQKINFLLKLDKCSSLPLAVIFQTSSIKELTVLFDKYSLPAYTGYSVKRALFSHFENCVINL